MLTTERLLASAHDLWKSYNEHPFVLGIQNGDLAREKFRFYTIQDYLYLLDYAKVFAIGLSKADDPAVMHTFAQYIVQIMDCEMNVHEGYMAELSITPEELRTAKPALANLSYTAYMRACAEAGGPAEAITAVLACAVSYEHIAREMLRRKPDADKHPFYGAWVESYASDAYAQENVVLCELVNKLTADYTEPQLEKLCEIFRNCARYEAGFWDMAWKLER
ncbi:thiaminase II [Butyricicoccus pullicaecorum]|nr:thiaminase II [Butyricicoccus pullicaecorum]